MNLPTVSVVIAAFNAGRFISEALESVIGQSYSDLEIVVVDDGSTDNTAEIVESFCRADSRVTLHRISNSRQAKARNTGVSICHGDLIANLDADDVAPPKRIEEQVLFLEKHPNVVAVGGAQRVIDEQGNTIGTEQFPSHHGEIVQQMFAGNPSGGLALSASMVRRFAFERVGGFRSDFVPAEDYDLWLRLSTVGHLANIESVCSCYRLHLGSDSSTKYNFQLEQSNRALADACSKTGRPLVEIKSPWVQMRPLDRVMVRYLSHGRQREAFGLLRHSLRLNPFDAANLLSLARFVYMALMQSISGRDSS